MSQDTFEGTYLDFLVLFTNALVQTDKGQGKLKQERHSQQSLNYTYRGTDKGQGKTKGIGLSSTLPATLHTSISEQSLSFSLSLSDGGQVRDQDLQTVALRVHSKIEKTNGGTLSGRKRCR